MRTAGAKAALIVAAEEDEDFAKRIRKAARGFEIEIDDALPLREGRFVLLVWSAARPISAFDVPVLIGLWARGKLLIVRRDGTALPLGLGDLESVPANASAQDAADSLWRLAAGTAARTPPARRGSNSWVLGGGLAAVLLLGAGFWPEIQSRLSSDDRAGNVSPPPAAPSAGEMPWIWIGAAVVALVLLLSMRRGATPAARREATATPTAARPHDSAEAVPTGALFISCAAIDRGRIDPLLAEIESLGHVVWIDRSGLNGDPGEAGRIARAIDGSKAIVLMASPDAYASDQVVRQLHLALRSKKAIVSIELEPAEPPLELAHLLAPFPRHTLPPGDRKSMLRHALDAA